jgi:hypothetical protein
LRGKFRSKRLSGVRDLLFVEQEQIPFGKLRQVLADRAGPE